jgi:hypothetical protein
MANGYTESWSNGMIEGFGNLVKWIKRSSSGQAGFPLLQRRVLLHPTTRKTESPDTQLTNISFDDVVTRVYSSQDFAEEVRAHLEKRRSVWRGQ